MGFPSLCVKMLHLSHYRPQYVIKDTILRRNLQLMCFKYHRNNFVFPTVLGLSVGNRFLRTSAKLNNLTQQFLNPSVCAPTGTSEKYPGLTGGGKVEVTPDISQLGFPLVRPPH